MELTPNKARLWRRRSPSQNEIWNCGDDPSHKTRTEPGVVYFNRACGRVLVGDVAISLVDVVGWYFVFLDVACVSAAFGSVKKSADTRSVGDVARIVLGDPGAVRRDWPHAG